MKQLLALRVLPGLLLLAVSALAASLPEAPRSFVLDEPGALKPRMRQALSALLIEHDRLTGEEITLAIFKGADHEAEQSRDAFALWKTGHARANGILLAVFWDSRHSRLEIGFALDAVLPDSKTRALRHDILEPELRTGDVDRALALATLELLTDLESPLVQSGKAQEILRQGGFQGSFVSTARFRASAAWFLWPLLGIFLIAGGLLLVTAPDAHYTAVGWFRPQPWKQLAWQRLRDLLVDRLSPKAAQRHAAARSQLPSGGTHGSW